MTTNTALNLTGQNPVSLTVAETALSTTPLPAGVITEYSRVNNVVPIYRKETPERALGKYVSAYEQVSPLPSRHIPEQSDASLNASSARTRLSIFGTPVLATRQTWEPHHQMIKRCLEGGTEIQVLYGLYIIDHKLNINLNDDIEGLRNAISRLCEWMRQDQLATIVDCLFRASEYGLVDRQNFGKVPLLILHLQNNISPSDYYFYLQHLPEIQ